MLVTPLLTYTCGIPILLKTRPVDPRDVFRGDYVTLGYECERLSKDMFEDIKLEYNMDLYAVLKSDGGIYIIEKVVKDKPKSGLYVKGTYRYQNSENVEIDIGLDKYFVPEGTGKKYEDMARKGTLYARIKILGDNAVVDGLQGK